MRDPARRYEMLLRIYPEEYRSVRGREMLSTLLEAGDPNAFNATLYDKLGFDFIKDFVPVASIDRAPFVMVVNPSSPAKTVAEFITYAKANASKLNMGASGVGGPTQLYGELFKSMTGLDMVAVQYRGVGAALPDLIGGGQGLVSRLLLSCRDAGVRFELNCEMRRLIVEDDLRLRDRLVAGLLPRGHLRRPRRRRHRWDGAPHGGAGRTPA